MFTNKSDLYHTVINSKPYKGEEGETNEDTSMNP